MPAFHKRPDAIIARNIFCAACAPLVAAEDSEGEAGEAGPSSTTLPLVLLAVMHAAGSHAGSLSIAILKDSDSKRIGAFALGDRVHGATVTGIWQTRIYLDHAGTEEYLDLLATPAPRMPACSACEAAAPKAKTGFAAELDRGIKQVSEHRYQLERRTLESALENMALLSRAARPMPEVKDGKMTGFRLFAVHPDGPAARVGLQSGDVISSINGLEITSPDKVIEALGKLRSASNLALQLERGGRRVTHEYVIR